jgi:DNA polymerase III subunit delta
MTYKEIISDLDKKLFHPVYFLCGEEPFYIDMITNAIEKSVLDETEREFNQFVFYGRDSNLATVLDAAYRFPMMANYQVIIVKEAQDLKDLIPRAKEKSKNSKEDEKEHLLVSYLDKPQKTTVLVFCYKYKTLDMRTSLAKKMGKSAVLFESKKLYENQVPAWIENYLKDKGLIIGHKALALLTEYLGNDLSKISNELGKLMINISPPAEITVNDIEQNIGISKDYNVFELHNALGSRDAGKAMRIINYFASNTKDNPFVVSMGALYSYFTKLLIYHTLKDKSPNSAAASLGVSPFFVKDYISAAKVYSMASLQKAMHILKEYDLKSKGVGNISMDEAALYKELILKLVYLDKVVLEEAEQEIN